MFFSALPCAAGVWSHLRLAPGAGADDTPLPDAAIVVTDGKVAWVGERAGLPGDFDHLPRFDAEGALATPGLVDCHTHLVYGGQRANEFALWLAGADYEAIARQIGRASGWERGWKYG